MFSPCGFSFGKRFGTGVVADYVLWGIAGLGVVMAVAAVVSLTLILVFCVWAVLAGAVCVPMLGTRIPTPSPTDDEWSDRA